MSLILGYPERPRAEDSPVFQQRDARGQVVFSDAPMNPETLERRHYKGRYGRPTATASCSNLQPGELARRRRSVEPLIRAASERHGVDPLLALAVARTESCFHRTARSRAGAEGIMQLMPATAADLGVHDRFNAEANINGGVRYLAEMLDRQSQDARLALASYNAGPGAVAEFGGIPPFPETQTYVRRVLHHLERYRRESVAAQ